MLEVEIDYLSSYWAHLDSFSDMELVSIELSNIYFILTSFMLILLHKTLFQVIFEVGVVVEVVVLFDYDDAYGYVKQGIPFF